MKNLTKAVFILGILLIFSVNLSAAQKILIHIRLYEGVREKTADGVLALAESDTLNIKQVKIYSSISSTDEKESLMKIYGLDGLKEQKSMKIILQGDHSVSLPVPIGNKRVDLHIMHIGKKTDEFEILMVNAADETEILKTRIILPQQKTVILGLKDRETGLLFLSLKREKDQSDPGYPATRAIIYPSARVMVTPQYPPEAKEKKIEGVVRVKMIIDENGDVSQVEIIKGDFPLLNEAVIKAVKQWKYDPMTINGHLKSAEAEIKIVFKLD
jgi:protein TonB